jgi:hypothetical protein
MPLDARLWVYQSNRNLLDKEVATIEQMGDMFITDWSAHGASLKASFTVLHNLFIVISVDESQAMASGCSIDKALKFIQHLEKEMNLNLLDRMQVAYRTDNEIRTCSLSQFENLAKSKNITENTIVFNNMVTTKAAFDTNWEIPLSESWQNRVLN